VRLTEGDFNASPMTAWSGALFHVKQVPFTRVELSEAEPRQSLLDWTAAAR